MEQQAQTLTALDKSVATLIEGATTKGAQLVDWLYLQAPDVVNQLMLWNAIESILNCLFGVLFLAVPFIVWKVANHLRIKMEVSDWGDETPYWCTSILGGGIISLASIIIAFHNINFTWLKIWIAPKVYLLEYLAHLAK